MAKKKKRKGGGRGLLVQFLIIALLLLGVMFSSIAIVLMIGMIPTIVSMIVDATKGKTRTITVGCVNFAGCTPFLVEMIKKGNNIETAVNYILEPRTIVVMYMAAAMGYLIDWALTGIVSSIMVQKAKRRLKDIETEKKGLVERWGMEVTGAMALDEYGFPLEAQPAKAADE
jgi:hypothetical protein